MRSKRKTTSFPVRWQPHAELTAAGAAACGGAGEGSLHTSLLAGGRRDDGIVERNLLSQFKGEANQQVTNDRAEPPLALSLRVGSQEQPQNRLWLWSAPTRQSPSLLPAAGSSAPPPQLGSNSLQLSLGARATPPQQQCGVCNLHYDRLAADMLRRVSEDLDRRVGLLRQGLSAEVGREVLRLHAAAAALPAAFAAAGLTQPQPQQPCSGGAWCWCPGCGARQGTVALKPYEHLCLCAPCSHDARRVGLVCSFACTGAVENATRGRGRGRGL